MNDESNESSELHIHCNQFPISIMTQQHNETIPYNMSDMRQTLKQYG